MNASSIQLVFSRGTPRGRRRVLAALLLAALILPLFAASTEPASASPAPGPNQVKNGSFENDSDGDGIPNNWVGNFNLTPADKRVCNQSKAGNCSFKMVGDGSSKILSQELAVSGLAGDQFDISAWARGKDVIYGAGSARGYVLFNHVGGGNNETFFGISNQTFPWAFYKLVAVEATADYYSITVFLQYSTDSGKLWVDKVKLVAVP